MKVVTSIRINQDILNHLRHLEINISEYINNLLLNDLRQQSFKDTELKKVVDLAIKEEKKATLLKEMKLIGAINNIGQRLEDMSKGNEMVFHALLKKNIELLELEYDFEYSKETKQLIKSMFMELQKTNRIIEPYEKLRYLTNDYKKKY